MRTSKWKIPNHRSVPSHTPKENKLTRNPKFLIPFLILLVVGNFFFLQLLNSQYSTLSLILLGATVVLLVAALFVNLRKKQRAKLFNYVIVGFAVFVVAFSGLGFYMYQFYGPTVPQVGYPGVLDASLSSYLQALKESASFRFVQLQHFGSLTFESLSIHTTYSNAPQGGVSWDFYAADTKSRFSVGQSSGDVYSFSALSFGRGYVPLFCLSDEQVAAAFGEIDALGLDWFLDKAVLEYQNATGLEPDFTDLVLDVGYDTAGDSEGITFTVTALREDRDSFGAKIYPRVFEVEFAPNGSVLSAKT